MCLYNIYLLLYHLPSVFIEHYSALGNVDYYDVNVF